MEERNCVLLINNSPGKNSNLYSSSNINNSPGYSSSILNEKHNIYSSKLLNYFNQQKLLIKKLLPSNFNDINNKFIEVKIKSITEKIFILFEKIYRDSDKLIKTYEQMLQKSENEVRSLYREIFILKSKNNSLENDKFALLIIKKEFDLIRQKTGIFIENGVIVNNNRKDNEIFILHKENSKLKNIIKKNDVILKKNKILVKYNNLMKKEILSLNSRLKELSKGKQKRKIISIIPNSPIINSHSNTSNTNRKKLCRKNEKFMPIGIFNNKNSTINNLLSYPFNIRLNDRSIDLIKSKKIIKKIITEKYKSYSETKNKIKKYMDLVDMKSAKKKYKSVTPENKLKNYNYYKKKDMPYNSSFNYNLHLVKKFKKIKTEKNLNFTKRNIPISKGITKYFEKNNNIKKALMISLRNIKNKNESTISPHFPSFFAPCSNKFRRTIKYRGKSMGMNSSSLRGRSYSKSNSISISKMEKKCITKNLLKHSLKRKVK